MRKFADMLPSRPKIIGYRKSGAPIYLVQGAADEDPIERLEERNSVLAEAMEKLLDEMKVEGRSADQKEKHEADWKAYEAELDKNTKEIDELRAAVSSREARLQKVRDARSKWGSQTVKTGVEDADLYNVDIRMLGGEGENGEYKSLLTRALRALDQDDNSSHLEADQKARVAKLLRTKNSDSDGEVLSMMLLATSNPHYRSAFQKATSTNTPVFTEKEARAVRDVRTLQRAMAIGSTSTGGFAVPIIIDPTVIITAQGSSNDLLRLARVETITNDTWRGLSSAGVSWKFDAEASASTDNSPTIAQPTVPTYRADGFIPFSIEVGMDWPGFAEQMSAMLGSGYEELLADKLTNGTGANTPKGLMARLFAQTAPDVSTELAAAGVLAPKDIYALWARLPQRHRRKANTAFMSSTDVQNAIRQLGTLDPNFTVDITNEAIPRLFGREYPMNDYMPSMPTGTGVQNLLAVGDFHGFLVAQRAGMTIEYVPMLFDVTNNRPTGQRGWFAYARVGSDVVDPTAFQLLTNRSA